MSEDDVKAFLRYPSKALVDFALTLVNLTWQERTAVDLCIMQGYTQEAAAEKAGTTDKTMQRWHRAAIGKLCAAWAETVWIKKVIS